MTEKEIASIKEIGGDHVRIPVGDWMFDPYEPFVDCWDGALDELNRVGTIFLPITTFTFTSPSPPHPLNIYYIYNEI